MRHPVCITPQILRHRPHLTTWHQHMELQAQAPAASTVARAPAHASHTTMSHRSSHTAHFSPLISCHWKTQKTLHVGLSGPSILLGGATLITSIQSLGRKALDSWHHFFGVFHPTYSWDVLAYYIITVQSSFWVIIIPIHDPWWPIDTFWRFPTTIGCFQESKGVLPNESTVHIPDQSGAGWREWVEVLKVHSTSDQTFFESRKLFTKSIIKLCPYWSLIHWWLWFLLRPRAIQSSHPRYSI